MIFVHHRLLAGSPYNQLKFPETKPLKIQRFTLRAQRLNTHLIALLTMLLCTSMAHSQEVSFNRDIRPILSDRCFACHGPAEHGRKAKLRLDQAEGPNGAHRVDDGIAVIKPGSLKGSELWYRITTDDEADIMPPPKANKKLLTAQEKALFKKWIEQGAKYDRFWAFEPARMPLKPVVEDRTWSDLPIDLFVLRKLESHRMKPSPDADRRTLIRRVTFDLTGLPPTRDEIKTFLNDTQPGAYERLVDRLLAKPQFGEHIGRYWLDLVRFADTNGMHKDFYRNTYAYRDWVIRAFNENLGYDDFVRYQLAGDLYPNPTNDQLAASGFHRLHLIIDRGTALPEESFAKNVFDRVTSVGTAFFGLTMHCARCHEHKYDPITHEDYYSLFAFFNNIDAAPETPGRPRNGLQAPFVSLATEEQTQQLKAFDQELAAIAKKLQEHKAAVPKEKDAAKKNDLQQAYAKLQQQHNTLKKKRDAFDNTIAKAMVMKERPTVRPTFVLTRGEYDQPSKQVQRDTPGFLPPLKKKGEVASRMDLANWFVTKEHPLTARVAVNRFWQQFFGVGLVKTSEDFGAQGEVPSHPALLDYLAVRFVESGWDVKAMMKEIVLSKTYRQSSVATTEQLKKDPENRLLARGSRFRMDAEMIRDQILATSGLLSPKLYGPSVKPPQPDGLWKSVTMIGERFTPDSGDAIYRRSVYTYWKRGMPPPQMTILNAPIRDACVARRERTNTPAQALLLLNEPEYLKAARNLAQAVLNHENLDDKQRLQIAYETVTSKLPDDKEQAILLSLLKDLQAKYRESPELANKICQGVQLEGGDANARLAAWTIVGNTLFNLDITKTRE